MTYRLNNLQKTSFWKYQLYGWLMFWFIDSVSYLSGNGFDIHTYYNSYVYDVIGFLITLTLWRFYRHVQYLKVSAVLLLVACGIISFAASFVWVFFYKIITIYISRGSVTLEEVIFPQYFSFYLSISYPVILGWTVLYFGIKFWKDWFFERERADRANAIAQQTQLEMLRYQLNPHFLFNALNSVRALIDEDKKTAKRTITELSDFLRYSLLSRNRPDVTLGEEIEALKHYISIEEHRYENKIQVTFSIDPMAEGCPILSFLMHPLLENAVKYGMKTSPMPLKIKVSAALEKEKLHISISASRTCAFIDNRRHCYAD